MRIIILGSGQVGSALARNLVNEAHDVVLIDSDPEQLDTLKNRLDIQTLAGSASSPKVLVDAGIQQADLLIAVTPSDDTNMVACLIARNLFKIPRTIARIRSEDYYAYPELFHNDNIPIQILINPEQLITEHIIRIIEYPGVSQILSFSDEKTCLITVETQTDDWMHGKSVAALNARLKSLHVAIITIFNQKKALPLQNDYILNPKDKVLFITQNTSIHAILRALERQERSNQRITIAGGGIIGRKLAERMQDTYQVTLIEKNPLLAATLASELHNVIVLQGDIADRELLLSENIEATDVFCAVTDDDETNIMGSLQAKFLGAKSAMTLVNREAYVELIEDSFIDYALSPQLIAIGNILSKLRRGNIVKIYGLQEEESAVIELVVAGTGKTSAVVGRPLQEIELPPHCILAGVMRGKKLHLHTAKLHLAADDHVILLLLKKKYMRQLEALFQVNLDFMS